MRTNGIQDWGLPALRSPVVTNGDAQNRGYKGAAGRSPSARYAFGKYSKRAVIIGSLATFWTVLFGVVAFVSLDNSSAVEKRAETTTLTIEKPAQQEMQEVLVPVKDILPDQSLEASMFIKVWRPKMSVSKSVFRSFEDLRGMYAKSYLPAHQPFTREVTTGERPQNAVVANIPDGFRAVSISVTATSSVEGWARAGAKVDVHWIADVHGERSARVLVQNARVLSAERQVDQRAEAGAPVPTTVTLLVTERDAQKVSLAQTAGTLVLHLRGANDVKSNSGSGTLTLSDLLGSKDGDLSAGVEGVARVKGKNGKYEEFAIIGGRMMKKSSAEE